MPEVGADFWAMAAAGLITNSVATSWTEDLTFILQNQCAKGFQIQLHLPRGTAIALDYKVSADGSIRESSSGGGIDYYALPAGTEASLFVDLDEKAPRINTARAYTAQRGWGNGQAVEGATVRDRAYSNNGYGFIRNRVGAWPA
jgi:hypothetical protein